MKTLFSVASLCLLVCGSAPAQTYELSVMRGYPRISSAPLGSVYEQGGKDDDTKLKGLNSLGVRLTLNTPGYYGHEIGYVFNRAKLSTTLRTTENKTTIATVVEDGVVVRQVFYNFLMYFMPKGERWRPFITGGAQAHQYGAPDIEEFTYGTRNYGFNYGGGIKLKLFKNALVRLDFRDYIGGKPYDLMFEDVMKSGGWLRQLEASVGIAITF